MSEFDPELEDMAWRLKSERPAPSAAFRAGLREELAPGLQPRGLRSGRRLVLAYVASGLAAFALAAGGLLSSGPLASPESGAKQAASTPRADLVAASGSATGSAARSQR